MTKAEQKKHDDKLLRLRQIKLSRKPSQYNLVAFDQATLCGVAFQFKDTVKPYSQLWDLSIKAKESQGMKWLRFESRVKKFLIENKIEVLAYELPSGRNTNPIIHSSKLICILEKACAELEIEYIEYSSSQIKKFATGNGNAGKPLMIECAQKLWGYDGKDDNEADALHILHYLKSNLNF